MSATSPMSLPARELDTSPLTEPVSEQALNPFIARSKATDAPWRRMTDGLPRRGVGDIIGGLVPVLVPVAGVTMLVIVGGASLVGAVGDLIRTAPFPYNVIPIGVAALVGIALLVATLRIILIIKAMIIPRSWWEAAYRLTRFASANGLRYGHDETVPHSGVIFGTGTDRVAERRLTTTAGRPVEIANYRYTIQGEDKNQAKVYGWGYVAITLDRRLPHLLLDAKANNRSIFGIKTSNLPVDLAGDQKLSLGGEFDDKFTLYAPSEYGRDAFYVFTPDLMALFIDRLGTYDVEIIDDTMYVYGSRFDLLNPRTYDWLQEVVDTVVARTVRRTERYSDDFAALEADPARQTTTTTGAPVSTGGAPVFAFAGDQAAGEGSVRTATNTIAAGGRRLRRRTWGLSSVVVLLLVAFWIYNDFVAPLFGLPRLEHD